MTTIFQPGLYHIRDSKKRWQANLPMLLSSMKTSNLQSSSNNPSLSRLYNRIDLKSTSNYRGTEVPFWFLAGQKEKCVKCSRNARFRRGLYEESGIREESRHKTIP